MANGVAEARKLAVTMTISASLTALLALAIWFDVFNLGLDVATRQVLAVLLAIVSLSEAVLGRVLYLRKLAGK